MNSIGGYFELEINDIGSLFHDKALALNSGRNCLEYILENSNYNHIYIPYFTCDVILEPIIKLGITYTFYSINKSFLPLIETIKNNEALLYTNYFGLMSSNIDLLSEKYKNIIVDNSQAFYDRRKNDIPTFYSPRKFFGVSDGGFVYHNKTNKKDYDVDISLDRFNHLLKSVDISKEGSYVDFKKNDNDLVNQPIKKMSKLTQKILRGVDYNKNRLIRLQNFKILHHTLKESNQLTYIIDLDLIECPMVYPYLPPKKIELRNELIKYKIYTAQYWPNVMEWVGKDSFEYILTDNVVYLPIDQRYSEKEMKYMLNCINK
ncbi:MAG: hypothetical protein H6587_12725 [Flavobacteriales bacterium]|nr:hypothetical protein [Flavobacteriales bacterium]MCB9365428.1 hypothetical protein [Flavobacteriales bacterium]